MASKNSDINTNIGVLNINNSWNSRRDVLCGTSCIFEKVVVIEWIITILKQAMERIQKITDV
ncbi:hypothethical protein [Staphylococcus caprae]|uniref:Hypothethical protein n=1 Tax=Staphylococcus caprae TaxID=29380 RepID=A0ABM7FUG2_9STAP|nr:hypothethical protein [Staphylococcus caprae]BBD91536.1 hypothethical protein [Staphylococcus caprae]BBD94039.1 hypothetical protein JMUB898_0419 [Staphylococcus caprae]